MSDPAENSDSLMVDVAYDSGRTPSSASQSQIPSSLPVPKHDDHEEIRYMGTSCNAVLKTAQTKPTGAGKDGDRQGGGEIQQDEGEVGGREKKVEMGSKEQGGAKRKSGDGDGMESWMAGGNGIGEGSGHSPKKHKPSTPNDQHSPPARINERQPFPYSFPRNAHADTPAQSPKYTNPPHQSQPVSRPIKIKLPPEIKKETRITDFINLYVKNTLKCPIDAYKPSGGVDGAMLEDYVDGSGLKREKERLEKEIRGRWHVDVETGGAENKVYFVPRKEYSSGADAVLPFNIAAGDYIVYQKVSRWNSPDITDATKARNPESIDSAFSRFGRIISINDEGTLHIQQLRHDLHSPLHAEKAHPKRLHELQYCKSIHAKYVVKKIAVVREPNAIGPGKTHPVLGGDTYLLQYTWNHSSNAFTTVGTESPLCGGCQHKTIPAKIDADGLHLSRRRNQEEISLQVGDFINFFNDDCTASGLCGIGEIVRFSQEHQAVRVRAFDRWDVVVDEAFGESASVAGKQAVPVLRKDRSLLYMPKQERRLWVKLGDVVGQTFVLSASQAALLDRELRHAGATGHFRGEGRNADTGLPFIGTRKDIFYLVDDGYLAKLWLVEKPSPKHLAKLSHVNFGSSIRLSDGSFAKIKDTLCRELAQRSGISHETAIIDCCAGVGAFSLGMQHATGATISIAVEPDEKIARLYKQTHPEAILLKHGAGHVGRYWKSVIAPASDIDKYGNVVLLAGIPCQGFSGLNTHKKAEDPRNGIIYEVLSLLQVSQAAYLLIENVPGILFHKNGDKGENDLESQQGEILRVAARILADMGYQVNLNLYRSEGYGLPSCRRRVFLWATKNGRQLPPPPTPSHPYDIAGDPLAIHFGSKTLAPLFNAAPVYANVSVLEAMSDLRPLATTGEASQRVATSSIWGFLSEKSYLHQPLNTYQETLRLGAGKRTDLHYCRVPDGNTLTKLDAARKAMINRNQTLLGTLVTTGLWPHTGQVRPLSLREICRVTGFPDRIHLHMEVTEENKGREYDTIQKAMGNAVPVLLAGAHGEALMKSLIKE